MKKGIIVFFLLSLVSIQAQNKKILYGFDKIPQGLLLNPGQESSYRYHVGIPLLSNIYANANISGITLAEVFGDDSVGAFEGTDFNEKVANALNNLGDKDYISASAQVEVANFGYKINRRDYLTVGFYEEVDVFVGFPKDLLTLGYEGNADYLNKAFSVSGVAVKAEALGVLHAGVTRRFNNGFTAGARLKIYSGAINVTSVNNKGSFVTTQGVEGIYRHTLSNLEAGVKSAGFYDEDGEFIEPNVGDVLGDTFFGKNLGLGIDVGITYHFSEQLELTASLLDVGFVNYSKNIRRATAEGDYSFSGIDFEYEGDTNYFEELKDDFSENVAYDDENTDSYTVLRPIKFNSSLRYSFGKSRYLATCHDIRKKDYFDNAVGAQLFAIARPYGLRMALTGFYERKFADFLNTKITYTIDDFSASNIGLGISTNIWKFNVYGMVDNVFKLGDITDAHTVSAQFGINFIMN